MSLTDWLPKNAFVMRKKNLKTLPAAATTQIRTTGNPFSKLIFVTTALSPEALALLEKMILAMGFKTSKEILISVAEGSFDPAEFNALIAKVQPQIIVALGLSKEVLTTNTKTVFIPHPTEMLKNPALKKQAWEELKSVMRALALP